MSQAATPTLSQDFDPETALANGELRDIAFTDIIPDEAGLRVTVDKKKSSWGELVADIERNGIQHAITVRVNPLENATHPYIIIDGFHRFSAAQEIWEKRQEALKAAGEPPMSPEDFMLPCNVVEVTSPMDVYRLQIGGNIQTIETRQGQLCDHLHSMIAIAKEEGRDLTQADLAAEINKSQTFVSNVLKLKNLTDEARKKVDSGEIVAANAYRLAQLPPDEQVNWIERAEQMEATEFATQSAAEVTRLKALTAEERKKRGDAFPGVQPKLVTRAVALQMLDHIMQNVVAPRGGEQFVKETSEAMGKEYSDDFVIGLVYGMQCFLQIDAETVQRKEAEHRLMIEERNRKKAAKERDEAITKANERGVNILMPEGKPLPTGFQKN